MGTGDGKSDSNQNPSIKYLSEDGGASKSLLERSRANEKIHVTVQRA
jgi:hypothetical protein